MKLKKTILISLSFILITGVLISAKPVKSDKEKGQVVIGEIKEVNKNDKGEIISITVEGYIKGKEVIKTTVVGLINKDTKMFNSNHDKKEDILIKKGDIVYLRVDEAMTKSLPPQTNVKRLFITNSK
ncbi:hypothetical protein [Clostridium sp.]|uniref:hypothetical protein n=1 Tax=Clostridium sp. TaxID=1506 RepID=UPI002607CA6B|nr:hypothetical protein [Clostridium sp.]